MDPEQIRKYFQSRIAILKTLRYRGYRVSEDHDLTIEEFTEMYSHLSLEEMKEEISYYKFDEAEREDAHLPPIIIVWFSDRKLGARVREIHDAMEEMGATHALVVVDEGVTPSCVNLLKNLRTTKKMFIDTWTLEQSMIFVPEHALNPKFRICTTREKKEVFDAYGLKSKSQSLPWIKSSDIMVKYLGARKNQLLEITRPSETNPTQQMISYRLVV